MCAWSENLRRVVRWSSRCESRGVLLPLFRDRILLGGISNIISTAFADARKMGVGETLVSKSIYKCLMWIGQFFGSQGAIACGRLPPLDWSQRRCWRQYQTRSLWWCHRCGSYKTLKPCSSRDSCSNIERTHITYEIIKIYCSKMIRPDKMYIRYTLTALKNSGGYQLSYISSHSGMELIQDPRTKSGPLWGGPHCRAPCTSSTACLQCLARCWCFISCFKVSLQQSVWGYRMLLWMQCGRRLPNIYLVSQLNLPMEP